MNNQVSRVIAAHDVRKDGHLCARDRRVLARLLGRAADRDGSDPARPAASDGKNLSRAA